MWLRVSEELSYNLALATKITIEPPEHGHGGPDAVEIFAYIAGERIPIFWADTFTQAIALQVGIFRLIQRNCPVTGPDNVQHEADIWMGRHPQ